MSKHIYTIEEKMHDRIIELLANEEFVADLDRLKEFIFRKNNIKSSDKSVFLNRVRIPHDKKGFKDKLSKFRKKYGLSDAYTETIIIFALMNLFITGFNLNDKNFAVAKPILQAPAAKGQRSEKHLFIEVFPETTITDIQKSWPQTLKIRDEFYKIKTKKERRSPKLLRDKYIFDLNKQGKTAKQIAKILNNDERFSKKPLSYNDVPIIIRRLVEKSRRNITPQKI